MRASGTAAPGNGTERATRSAGAGRRALIAVLLGGWVLLACACGGGADRPLGVFAAASLVDVLEELRAGTRAAGERVFDLHVAGSETLLAQVRAGAPADLLVVARPLTVDERPASAQGEPRVLATSPLVMAVADGDPCPGGPEALSGRRVAMADPALAPAGRYARAALQRHGVWDALEGGLLLGRDVRDACSWVVLHEADVVLCYAADVTAVEGLTACAALGEEQARYELWVVAPPERRGAARALAATLFTPPARAALRAHGFDTPW